MSAQEWLKTTYFQYLVAQTSTSMNYLHTTISWTTTLLPVGVALIVASESFPDPFSLIGLLFIFIIMNHLAVRTAKAYLNVMRYSTLQKQILKLTLESGEESDWQNLKKKILQYDFEWISPLPLGDLIYKVFMELGFVHYYLIIILLLLYTLFNIEWDPNLLGVALLGLFFTVTEFWLGLKRSVYLRKILVDPLSQEQR